MVPTSGKCRHDERIHRHAIRKAQQSTQLVEHAPLASHTLAAKTHSYHRIIHEIATLQLYTKGKVMNDEGDDAGDAGVEDEDNDDVEQTSHDDDENREAYSPRPAWRTLTV